MKAAKLRLKNEEKKISEGRQKLTKQKHDISHAIDKLYVVEKGIAEKFQELENLLETSKNLRADGMNGIEEYANTTTMNVLEHCIFLLHITLFSS